MAGPAVALLFTYLMLPFLLGFVLSLTDQRLVSPNPAKFVDLASFSQVLGVDTLVLEPVRDDGGAPVRDDSGALTCPSLRDYTRDREAFPQYYGMKELFAFNWGGARVEVVARDLVFAFDGAKPTRRYAGKIVDTGAGLAALAFIHTSPEQQFVGEVSNPVPVHIDDEGLLHLTWQSKAAIG
jgi:multiple sugar transport system permease protein